MEEKRINISCGDRIKYVKKCPKCYEINEKNANWCMECGKAIISVEIRRCDSFPERKDNSKSTQIQRSDSQPINSYAVKACKESNAHFVTSVNNLRGHNHNIGLQVDIKKGNIDTNASTYNTCYNLQSNSATFEEYQAQIDRNTDRNTAIYRRAVNDEKNQELPYFYAFDDLLYPNYAMDDPVMGFVLPSSHIVSNSRSQFCSQNYQNDENKKCVLKHNEIPASGFSKKSKRRRKKKEKVSVVAVSTHTKEEEKKKIETHLNGEKERLVNQSGESTSSSQLNLPEEIILYIFSFFNIPKLAACARVCKQFHRITSDESLWRSVVLIKKHNINDDTLHKIAQKHPSSLTISHCNTKNITLEGLCNLFRTCSQSLTVLDVSGSSGGVFVGESVLQHVSSRCQNIRSLDVSWSNVGNEGVQSICHASKRLVHLSLNGCQSITDESIKAITEKHCESLEVFEVFGCFNITPISINLIAFKCKQLRILNLGQCHKVTNPALCAIARGLSKLESLDIRGCKLVRDSSLREIIMSCHMLSTLVIANCPSVTDSTLITLASVCLQLRCLDVCGAGKITDRGVEALAKSCCMLRSLDLSSTKATGRSIMVISNNCRKVLESLKLSFCHSITDTCLYALVRNCKKLKSLHLYGCRPLRNLVKLMEINPGLKIEKESLR